MGFEAKNHEKPMGFEAKKDEEAKKEEFLGFFSFLWLVSLLKTTKL